MGHGRARVYNILTLIMVIATALFAVWVLLRMAAPPPATEQAQVAVPTIAQLPTETATSTPTDTPLPTFTPSATPVPPTVPPTETPTNTPVPVFPTILPTRTHTLTPSPTPTPTNTVPPTMSPVPTLTPSGTITATVPVEPTSAVAQITQQATVMPPSPFPFALKDGQVIFTSHSANPAECGWQGIGGQVYDVNGAPFTGVQIHVFGQGLDVFAQAGSNSLYGPSGWEVQVGNTLGGGTYQVEMQSATGTIVSQPVTVVFTANDCQRNLALVNFAATRPFQG